MIKKKGFGQRIWIYILITIILISLFLIVYKYFQEIKEKKNQVEIIKFVNDLEKNIQKTTNNYGSVKHETYYVGELTKKICFSEYGKATSAGIDNQEILDIIDGNIQKNVFLFTSQEQYSYYIDGIIIENLSQTKYGCYNISPTGLVKIRMEARGNGTLIGDPFLINDFKECVIKVPDLMGKGEMKPEIWDYDEKYFKREDSYSDFKKDSNEITHVCSDDGWDAVEVRR
ncbi:MAG: hypothetical protein ACOC2U_02275 [bacterium]